MNSINKQRFLTELGKLLTFMYDEDRQTALAMYGKMFDDAENEQSLMQFLVSPTRQAVVLARAYNAKERKLQVHAQPRSILEGEEPDVMPEFILAIDQIQQEASELQGEGSLVLADQFTLFADNVHPQTDVAVPDAEEEKPAADPAAHSEAEPAAPENAVDAFMQDFSIKDEELFAPQPEEKTVLDEEESQPEEEPVPGGTVRVPKTFLLILYVILAIPVTLLGVVLLLIPTLLFLALAAAAVAGGSVILSAAFSGFAVFADIMVVLGISLVVLALGLLMLWTFVWFVGGAIVGFINSIVRLGGKWCYKEVQTA